MKELIRERDANRTRKNYRKIAPIYNLWSWLTESKAAAVVIDFADIKNHQAILEVACGTGVVLEKIIKQNPDGRNVGLDLSPAMLNKARKRLSGYAHTNLDLIEADIFDYTFPDGSFDILINNFMIDLMPSDTFDKILKGFYRVIKPGGSLVISTFAKGTTASHRFWTWVARKFPDLLTGCRPVAIASALEKAGFTIEKRIQLTQNTFPAEVFKARKTIVERSELPAGEA